MASYTVNRKAVTKARELIDARQYVLDSEWGEVQPKADDENAFLEAHSWADYGEWFLGLTDDATDETKGRYGFVFGDFRRVHRSGLIACQYRAAECDTRRSSSRRTGSCSSWTAFRREPGMTGS